MESRAELERRTITDMVRHLRARRLTLTRLVRRAAPAPHVLPGNGSDDPAAADPARGRRPRIAQVDYAGELARVDAALARLRDGTFGRCRECGAFLGVGRLRSRPLAEHCWPCQARAEQQRAAEGAPNRAAVPRRAGGAGDHDEGGFR
jgi:RNA polymerase-binding transcription factor DksA